MCGVMCLVNNGKGYVHRRCAHSIAFSELAAIGDPEVGIRYKTAKVFLAKAIVQQSKGIKAIVQRQSKCIVHKVIMHMVAAMRWDKIQASQRQSCLKT